MSFSRKSLRERRDFLLKLVMIGVSGAALLGLLKWLAVDRNWVTTDNAYVTGNILPITADATGIVSHVYFEETQLVKKGDLLVSLDGQRAKATMTQAEAELARAVRNVGALFAYRYQVCQKFVSRVAVRDRTAHDLLRYKKAATTGAASDQVLQNTQDQLVALEANLQETRAELQAIDARIVGVTRTNHPDIESAKSRFEESYIEYLRQNIRAPATGFIAKRRSQVGQRVKPGDALLNIVPLDHLWVEANIWENRMSQVRPGQEALITVDLWGASKTYHGVVEGIVPGTGSVFASLAPDNATGNFIRIVQRVPVRIALRKDEIEESPLRPGLSTVTAIDVGGPLQSPNASIVKTTSNEYRTEIYDKDLASAQAVANKTITDNLVGVSTPDDSACRSARY
jgi:membrane fusion protein (multidrug efflux system)